MPRKSPKQTGRKAEETIWQPMVISEYQKARIPFSSQYGIWKGRVRFSEREITRARIKAH